MEKLEIDVSFKVILRLFSLLLKLNGYELIFVSLPDPNQETVNLRKVEGGLAAVLKFSGKPTEDIVCEKEKELRSELVKDSLKPKTGCLLARYNDPGRTWSFTMVRHVEFVYQYLIDCADDVALHLSFYHLNIVI